MVLGRHMVLGFDFVLGFGVLSTSPGSRRLFSSSFVGRNLREPVLSQTAASITSGEPLNEGALG